LVEQRTENPRVVGSIPTLATTFYPLFHTPYCLKNHHYSLCFMVFCDLRRSGFPVPCHAVERSRTGA
jgi:hypothetical protein